MEHQVAQKQQLEQKLETMHLFILTGLLAVVRITRLSHQVASGHKYLEIILTARRSIVFLFTLKVRKLVMDYLITILMMYI